MENVHAFNQSQLPQEGKKKSPEEGIEKSQNVFGGEGEGGGVTHSRHGKI